MKEVNLKFLKISTINTAGALVIIKLRNTFIVQLKLQNLSQALSYSIKNWLSIIVSFIKFASHELQTTRREGKSAGSFTGRQIRKHKFPLKRECFYYFQHPLTLLRFTRSKTLSELRHINIHRTPSPLKNNKILHKLELFSIYQKYQRSMQNNRVMTQLTCL